MHWNQYPEVTSPLGRTIEEQLAPRPRRQPLEGFEAVYSDIVDYIVRCTHRIWEQKNPGLCRTHYAKDAVMHTLAGPTCGVDAVIQNTIGSLSAYTDRHVIAEDVIWSEDEPGLFLSSHRITSAATHLGDDAQGTATLGFSSVTTIADCLVRENHIIEEWLVRDNITAVRQAGLDPEQVARCAATHDAEGDRSRHAWRHHWLSAVRAAPWRLPPDGHPARQPAEMLNRALVGDLPGEASLMLSPCVEVRWPSGRHGFGRGYWIGCVLQLRAALHRAALRLDHWAARPLPNGDVAVALRWSLAGVHSGYGVWGKPTGHEVLVLAITHFRLRSGLIIAEQTVFDELAILRQVSGGLCE